MGVSWTDEQKQVINLRGRNILVSAAAGSGKTAVLVERILSKIMDREHPVDIDHLLIVTFTNAAAGEMKERIREAIEKQLEEQPENVHLQRQLTLIHHAQITTIHSFCQYVIRNYFHTIDLDPNFRIGDEGEMKLLRNDVAEGLLEELYGKIEGSGEEREEQEEGAQGFSDDETSVEKYRKFVECYAYGKHDKELTGLILSLYDFSMSYPWPEKWLADCLKSYEIRDVSGLEDAAWMKPLLHHIGLLLGDCRDAIGRALAICGESGGPYMYEAALKEDAKIVDDLQKCETYCEYAEKFHTMSSFARLSTKKDADVSDEKKEQVKEIRDQVKKSLKNIQEQYFYQSVEQMVSDLAESRDQMEVLIDLTCQFHQQFSKRKREKNLLDFNDLEHMALNILVKEEDGQPLPTDAARQLAEGFEEIMIDEYQDSNLVQEYVLTSVSGYGKGVNNMFMVGDVKQSIYRFRLARPELFMGKYAAYSAEDSKEQKIELHKNFRSRSQVLSCVNHIFERIMTKNLGNITYDEAAALYPGADYPENSQEGSLDTEVLLLNLECDPEVMEESGETAVEMEARMIGKRIRELVGKAQIVDKKTGKYRPVQYGDIVILLRTLSGWDRPMAEILGNMGIPAFTGSQSGYFSATEVQTVLALLKVVDNPMQEISLAAVLRSPIVGLSDEEMAKIRSFRKEVSYPEACRAYQAEGENENLAGKLKQFYEMLEDFRQRVPYTAMHELLWYMLDRTGYGDYAAAMPGGEQRKANLDMLAEKAMAYESTSYRGLFNFVRYIEQLQKYEVDYGEANILGEGEDTVRIMSIHKSKGLEFPIVFVAGMNKTFNQQDTRSRLALHPDYGIGCDWVDPEMRIKAPTLLKRMIQRQQANENLGEELRVLYVALTRAKEKLILTGAVKLETKEKKWLGSAQVADQTLSFGSLTGAASYLDWIMPVLKRYGEREAGYRVEIFTPGDLAIQEATGQLESHWTRDMLLAWDTEKVYDEAERERIEKLFDWDYPWKDCMDIYGKITVSELKHMHQTQDLEETYECFPEEQQEKASAKEPDLVPVIPSFIQEKQEVKGAARGTVYHRLLEHLDYERSKDDAGIRQQVQELVQEGRMTEKEAGVIRVADILQFRKSSLGERMAAAAARQELFREQPFVLGVPADVIRDTWEGEDLVLVQGIIDAWFLEGDDIVLVDYKTDHVEKGQEQRLIDRYGIQLATYARALERLTDRKVKEQYIYSFRLQRALENKVVEE